MTNLPQNGAILHLEKQYYVQIKRGHSTMSHLNRFIINLRLHTCCPFSKQAWYSS